MLGPCQGPPAICHQDIASLLTRELGGAQIGGQGWMSNWLDAMNLPSQSLKEDTGTCRPDNVSWIAHLWLAPLVRRPRLTTRGGAWLRPPGTYPLRARRGIAMLDTWGRRPAGSAPGALANARVQVWRRWGGQGWRHARGDKGVGSVWLVDAVRVCCCWVRG